MGRFYIISGDDDFVRKQRARVLAEELSGGNGPDDPAMEIIPGDSDTLKFPALAGDFLNAISTPPFLCPSKLVWFRHLPDLEAFAEKVPPPAQEAIEFLSKPLPEELSVLIDGPGLDQRKAFAKIMKAAGAVIEIYSTGRAGDKNAADRRKLSIADFFQQAGKKIAPQAVQYLLDVIGGDSGVLLNELEKVRCYTGDAPEVTLADCTAVVSRTPEAMSWEYTSAIIAGKADQALKLLDLMLDDSGSEIRMIYAVSKEYQQMIQTRLAMKELGITRVNPRTFDAFADRKGEFPGNPLLKLHPYRAFKICEGALAISEERLAGKLTLIRDAARALVSGGGDRRIILEQLTLKLAR